MTQQPSTAVAAATPDSETRKKRKSPAHFDSNPAKAGWATKLVLVLLCFLTIAAFFLIVEHTAHFFGVLPFALVLLSAAAGWAPGFMSNSGIVLYLIYRDVRLLPIGGGLPYTGAALAKKSEDGSARRPSGRTLERIDQPEHPRADQVARIDARRKPGADAQFLR